MHRVAGLSYALLPGRVRYERSVSCPWRRLLPVNPVNSLLRGSWRPVAGRGWGVPPELLDARPGRHSA